MATILRNLKIREVSLVDKGANPGAKVVLYKRAEPVVTKSLVDRIVGLFRKSVEEAVAKEEPQQEEKQMDLASILAKLTPEEQEALKAALAGAQKAEEPEAKAEDKPEDEVAKALAQLPEAVRKQLEAAEAEKVEMRKRLEALEDERQMRIFVEKAEKLDRIPVAKAKLARIMKSASKGLPADEFAELERVLKSTHELLAKSKVFAEFGSSADGEPTAIAKLQAIAKSLREQDPTLTDARAFAKAVDLNPALHAEYRKEMV